jgi:hypothetical protein
MATVHFGPQTNDQECRLALYSGDIFILPPTSATLEVVTLARQKLEDAFAPHDPRSVHRHRSPEQVAEILADLKPRFIHDPACKKLISMIMAECGVDLDKLYFDVPRLRSAYPSRFLASGIAYAFHPHRDTWCSAPMCQLNWWMPVYPLQSDNAMGFFCGPASWRSPTLLTLTPCEFPLRRGSCPLEKSSSELSAHAYMWTRPPMSALSHLQISSVPEMISESMSRLRQFPATPHFRKSLRVPPKGWPSRGVRRFRVFRRNDAPAQ